MAILKRDGIDIHYDVRPGSQQSYLFVHGWCCNQRYFAPQASYFAGKGHTVVTLDLRGHGESTVPEGTPVTIANFAADVAAVIDAAGVSRPIAVGHSMGGITALNLAAEHPDRVAGIVMVDPAPLVWSDEFAQAIDGIIASMKGGDQGPQTGFIRDGLFLPTDDTIVRDEVVAEMVATPLHVAVPAITSARAFDGPGMAARCTVPALHIGAAMPLNSYGQLARLLEGVVNGQTVGAGHFNQLLVPVQVNDMIEQFARTHVWK